MTRSRKAAIDTNILLLVMFAANRRDPSGDTRLERYTPNDLRIVENLVCEFDGLIATANILTEMSNLTKAYSERAWLAEFVSKSAERYVPSAPLVQDYQFPWLGLTDLGLVSFEIEDCWVITDDGDLSNFLRAKDRNVIFYSTYRRDFLERN